MTAEQTPYYRNWRELIYPKRLEVNSATHTNSYGKFSCEPLERGYGITLGNALRRVLLSSLQGAAIVSVKIDGVLHELGTIPGVIEDVTNIILNLKGIHPKIFGEEEKTLILEKQGPGEVRGEDLIAPQGGVEILNPDHHIATLTEDGELRMEMMVKWGKGYVSAESNKDPEQPIGTIAIDALFSPIQKVNFVVTKARVGQMTDLKNANIHYIGELVQKSEQEMLKTKNFGRKSLQEIQESLDAMGLHLGMKLQGWSPPEKTDVKENNKEKEGGRQ